MSDDLPTPVYTYRLPVATSCGVCERAIRAGSTVRRIKPAAADFLDTLYCPRCWKKEEKR